MLAELKEYATEVDVDFVRKAVRAIGRCAIKVEVSGDDVILSSDVCLFKQWWQLYLSSLHPACKRHINTNTIKNQKGHK